jgi:small subunit ribosomal protein S11
MAKKIKNEDQKNNSKYTKKHSKKNKKDIKTCNQGELKVLATFNNTIISLTDTNGNVLYQCSAGRLGASGSKKASSHFASQVIENVLENAKKLSVKLLTVVFKGPGINGRDAVAKTLHENSNVFNVTTLKDMTPIPHNGCRARKRRRA